MNMRDNRHRMGWGLTVFAAAQGTKIKFPIMVQTVCLTWAESQHQPLRQYLPGSRAAGNAVEMLQKGPVVLSTCSPLFVHLSSVTTMEGVAQCASGSCVHTKT